MLCGIVTAVARFIVRIFGEDRFTDLFQFKPTLYFHRPLICSQFLNLDFNLNFAQLKFG